MPFKIIRNDITRVHADAVVNTANPKPVIGSGTDHAVYEAAGTELLLAERKKIGNIKPGDAVATSAFSLSARYIIHTVGPRWIDGCHGEYDILTSCYRKSLTLAENLGCKSIAFPLIATGVYGFPKEAALTIALNEIRSFLGHSDMTVTLVVFGRGTYKIASSLTDRVEAFIDENYVESVTEREYRDGFIGRDLESIVSERDYTEQAYTLSGEGKPSFGESPELLTSFKSSSIEDAISHLGESFQKRLFRMIDERGLSDVEVYKKANIDRKLFSKIRCSEDYIPKKKTILALAIGLRLNIDDTKDLLSAAGYSLTDSSKMDVIVRFCIENNSYDIFDVNALLFKFGQPVLG
jgi:O-acetyl-ADP-ribose deacetylase (regulator of RNase III)